MPRLLQALSLMTFLLYLIVIAFIYYITGFTTLQMIRNYRSAVNQ